MPTEAAAIATAASDIVLVEAEALGATRVIAATRTTALAAVANLASTPVWAVAGRGRRLPAAMVDAIVERLDQSLDPWSGSVRSHRRPC